MRRGPLFFFSSKVLVLTSGPFFLVSQVIREPDEQCTCNQDSSFPETRKHINYSPVSPSCCHHSPFASPQRYRSPSPKERWASPTYRLLFETLKCQHYKSVGFVLPDLLPIEAGLGLVQAPMQLDRSFLSHCQLLLDRLLLLLLFVTTKIRSQLHGEAGEVRKARNRLGGEDHYIVVGKKLLAWLCTDVLQHCQFIGSQCLYRKGNGCMFPHQRKAVEAAPVTLAMRLVIATVLCDDNKSIQPGPVKHSQCFLPIGT